eukprot:gene16687-5122_t
MSEVGPSVSRGTQHRVAKQIRNLDLSRNKLHSLAELRHLRAFRLAEIIVSDNPISAHKDYGRREGGTAQDAPRAFREEAVRTQWRGLTRGALAAQE